MIVFKNVDCPLPGGGTSGFKFKLGFNFFKSDFLEINLPKLWLD